MFSSGSAPVASADATAGEGTQMFSSGSASVKAEAAEGDATHMFSSGS